MVRILKKIRQYPSTWERSDPAPLSSDAEAEAEVE